MPYAAEESPSQDSTPSASGLDSRSFFSCSVTSGGPSTRCLTAYQNPSGSSAAVTSTAAIWSSSWSRYLKEIARRGRQPEAKVRDLWHRR